MQSTLLFLTGAALTLSGGAFAAPGGFYPNGGYEYYENIKPQFHEHNGYKYDPTISPPLRPKAPYPPKEPYGKDQFRNNYYPYGNDYDNRPAEIEIEVEFSVPEDFEVGRGFGNNYDYDGYNNNYPEPKYESRPKYEYGPRPENQYNPRPDVVVEPVLEVVEVDERERASDYKNDERFNNDKKSEDEREAKTLEGYEADNKIASSQLGFGKFFPPLSFSFSFSSFFMVDKMLTCVCV